MKLLNGLRLGIACLLLYPAEPLVAAEDCSTADELVRQGAGVGEPARREAAYLRALDSCPEHPGVLNNLADAYETMGRLDDALAYYRRAALAYRSGNASPDRQALPLFGLGDVYRRLGRDDEALYWYRQGLVLDPADADTAKAVKELTKGDPPELVGWRSLAAAVDRTRSAGVASAVALPERVLPFAYDSATLLPQAHAQLREMAHAVMDVLGATRSLGVLAAGPPVAELGGHADRRGTDAYNADLARRRAEAVVNALVEQFGIPRSRLSVASYGESRPLCVEDTEVCYARNRRVEFKAP